MKKKIAIGIIIVLVIAAIAGGIILRNNYGMNGNDYKAMSMIDSV